MQELVAPKLDDLAAQFDKLEKDTQVPLAVQSKKGDPYSLPGLLIYRVLIKYCVFSLKFRDFSELYCCSADVFFLKIS